MNEALIVIDMLVDFMEPGGALFCGDAAMGIVPEVERMVKEARKEGIPVLYITDLHHPEDLEFRMFPPHCVVGTMGSEVLPSLQPAKGDAVVPKRRFSGFFGTDLDLRLREQGIDSLVLVGVCTNICVFYTAADARMRGYRVVVARDAVASFDADAAGFALREMERTLGVEVVSTWTWRTGEER